MLSNGVKSAAIYLVFTFRILENSYRHSALITAWFTMGGAVSMETKCLWLIFRVHRTHNTFIRPKDVAVCNQNGFKTPCMH